MSTGTLAFGLEPNNVAAFLYGYTTTFTTQATNYAFTSTAPQASLDQAIANVVSGVTPPPIADANKATIEQQALAALATNTTDIANANAWLAANTATLTNLQLSNAMRSVMQAQVKGAQQRNKIIRFLLGKFDGTD